MSANALNRMAANGAMIGGAALGGVVVGAFGPGWGLAIDAVTFACAGLLFALVRVPALSGSGADGAADGGKPGLLHELREGWEEFVLRRWVWVIVLGFDFLNAAFSGPHACARARRRVVSVPGGSPCATRTRGRTSPPPPQRPSRPQRRAAASARAGRCR